MMCHLLIDSESLCGKDWSRGIDLHQVFSVDSGERICPKCRTRAIAMLRKSLVALKEGAANAD